MIMKKIGLLRDTSEIKKSLIESLITEHEDAVLDYTSHAMDYVEEAAKILRYAIDNNNEADCQSDCLDDFNHRVNELEQKIAHYIDTSVDMLLTENEKTYFAYKLLEFVAADYIDNINEYKNHPGFDGDCWMQEGAKELMRAQL